MNRKMSITSLLFSLTITTIFSLPSSAEGQLLPFGRQKTVEPASLDLTENVGPWLIMVTSFTGEDGRTQAQRLAQELRNEYRLDAYVYAHRFDFDKELSSKGKGWEVVTLADDRKDIRPVRMEPLSKTKFEEVAVLVGSFSSVDDSQAQKTLEKIKTLSPQSMENFDLRAAVAGEELAGEKLRAWRTFTSMVSTDPEVKKMGPLRYAFLLPNPMLPEEYFSARKVDQFVIKLNSDTEYTLLKNPGTYSVKVASFTGQTTLDLNEMEKIKKEDDWRIRNKKAVTQSKLVDAAKKATLLTYELRRMGYEAYEFHDRHESYVCVGAFDWLTREDENGTKWSNPDIEKTIMTFKGEEVYVPNKPGATKTFVLSNKLANAGIACDAQPLPVLIPKGEVRAAKKFFGNFR